MPFIDVKTSNPVTGEQEKTIKTALGEAISLIPGKSESSLMIQFQDNCRLWFRGQNESPIAFVNVMLYGKSEPSACQKAADEVIGILEKEAGVPKSNIYVKFEEVSNWFWG